MIINQTRIKTGGAVNVIEHVNKRDDNEVCERIFGSEDSLLFSEKLAQSENRKYSIRHFTVSPGQEISEDQTREMLRMIGSEFGFKDRDIAVYRHVKERSDGSKTAHFHILVSEQNADGRTMCNRANYARNEKLSRAMELKFGHKLIKGAHNRTVAQVAPNRAHKSLETLTEGPRPRCAFSGKAHQKALRLGVDLPAISHALNQLSGFSNAEKGAALSTLEADHNVIFERGDRRNVILIKNANREVITNANKSLSIKAEDVSEVIAAKNRNPETASHAENRDRHCIEEDRQHRASLRSDIADQRLSLRSRRSDERPGERSGTSRSDPTASGTTRTDIGEPDRTGGNVGTSGKRDGKSDRSIQLNDRNLAKQRLTSAATRSAANKSNSRMKFGNQTSSQFLSAISSGPEPASFDNNDPLYAEKVLDAWRRSMQPNGPSGP